MALYFITGNKGKFSEAASIIDDLEQIDIDLPEIQDIDAHQIIKAKLEAAFAHHAGPFIVEDTSLYFDGLGGLPGPFIKWFLKTLGNQGLFDLVAKLGNSKAQAKTIVGYAKDKDTINFFEGAISGTIVSPKGGNGHGWDQVFQPEGQGQTFAEMDADQKNSLSMRKIALEKLKEVLK